MRTFLDLVQKLGLSYEQKNHRFLSANCEWSEIFLPICGDKAFDCTELLQAKKG